VRDAAHSYRVISFAGSFPAAALVARSRRVREAFDRAFRGLLRGDAAAAEALASLLCTMGEPHPPSAASMRASLACVRSLLDEHSAEPLPLRALAEAARMSPFTLNRTFREQYGLPPHEYLNLVRVKRGQDLLRRGDRPLSELALDLGFADQAHFTRLFKRHVGVPPGRYRG
jgi:AraC-like DNA-binding protein